MTVLHIYTGVSGHTSVYHTLYCHARGREFKSRHSRQLFKDFGRLSGAALSMYGTPYGIF